MTMWHTGSLMCQGRVTMGRALRVVCHMAVLSAVSLGAQAQVGLTDLKIGDLPVTLVYPTAEEAKTETRGPFELRVAVNAVPRPEARRLVVMSHGTGGDALSGHLLASMLAQAGLVVAQPMHSGDNFSDTSRAGPESWKTRPGEVMQVVEGLAQHPRWGAQLRLDRFGLHGMSAGGMTVLTLAGGGWRTLNLVRHCLDNTDADAGVCYQGLTSPEAQAARRANYERTRGVPETFLPSELTETRRVTPDPRLASVTVALPLVATLSAESLAAIQVPVGVVLAGRDQMLLSRFHAEALLARCKACTRLADVPSAGHMDMLSPWPASVAQAVGARQARGGYPEPGFDHAQLVAAFERIVAFHKERLPNP